jgi:hypothetical protein
MTSAAKPTLGPVEIQNCTDVFTRLGAFNASGEKAQDNDGWHIADCATGFLPLAETLANAALVAEAFNVHTETGRTPRQLADERDELLAALKSLASFTDGNICRHETTHRGGIIWEICDGCGARWADDRGGKSDACNPASLTAALAIIAKVEDQT